MRTTAYCVKTPKGKIYPTWIFDNKEEAEDFARDINERQYQFNHTVFACEIKVTPPT